MKSARDLLWLVIVIALLAVTLPLAPREGSSAPRANPCRPPTELTFTPESFSFYSKGRNHAKPYTGFPPSSGFLKCNFDDGLLDHP